MFVRSMLVLHFSLLNLKKNIVFFFWSFFFFSFQCSMSFFYEIEKLSFHGTVLIQSAKNNVTWLIVTNCTQQSSPAMHRYCICTDIMKGRSDCSSLWNFEDKMKKLAPCLYLLCFINSLWICRTWAIWIAEPQSPK